MSELRLHLGAFRHNVATLAAIAAPARTMVAVKAEAYGHGMLPVAQAALDAGADSLAVLEVPAALRLRDAGVRVPLFAWLHGVDTDFAAAIAQHVDLGVSGRDELQRIVAAAETGVAAVHLKIDTGLHRNGASAEEWPALVRDALAAQNAGRVRIAGLWSHLADASVEADAAARAEFERAVALAGELGVPLDGPDRPLLHLAASSAGIREPAARFDLVRFGIAAYGVSPFDDVDGAGLGLRGTMTLRAEVLAVGDGRAVLDVGSADGIPPSVLGASGSGAEVLLGAHRVAVRDIEVDTMEVVASPHTAVGDIALVYGPGDAGEPTVEQWAAWAGTIGDEILARASRRVPRVIDT